MLPSRRSGNTWRPGTELKEGHFCDFLSFCYIFLSKSILRYVVVLLHIDKSNDWELPNTLFVTFLITKRGASL